MLWDIPLFSSVALLVLLQGPNINGVSQESVYVLDCIRDMIPTQIFNDCCVRENNCTITRYQNKGIDCMSRMILGNYSSYFSHSHDGGYTTTQMPYHSHNGRNNRWYGDVLETLGEICRRQPKGKLQTCIRNELIKRCRYSMLQDRVTSTPGRWNQRNGDYDGNDRWGGDNMDSNRRYNQGNQGSGRRQYGGGSYRPDYGDSGQYFRGNYDGDSDEEDFGYPDGDSMRYK